MDTAEIKADFEELYRRMNGMPLREMDKENFEGYPNATDVQVICTGTDVRVVSEQSECTPIRFFAA